MQPQRLAMLKELFTIEAASFNVFPLDDRKAERLDPAFVGRTSLTLYLGATHLGESTVPDVKNRSHSVTAEITIGDQAGQGAIIAQG